MAGGIFRIENKIRPGFYHRFTASERSKQLFGELGVAALPMELDWGACGEIIRIDSDAPQEEFMSKLGHVRDEIVPVRECLKRALTLLVYRVIPTA